MSDHERDQALELLRDSQLIERVLADYETCGRVGEPTNKLVAYLACVSRLLPQPLAIQVQSSSASGKTSLMDAALAVAEEEGVAQAAYALKLLQSDGRLRTGTTGKEQGPGRQLTTSYELQGPLMMSLTTTASKPDAELASRCLTLYVIAADFGHSGTAAGGLHPSNRLAASNVSS